MKLFLTLIVAGMINATYSPDSSKVAYTRDNDLFVLDNATQIEYRATDTGSDTVMNGYASWVYYEEIFGRQSNYRAFWWSPDSKKIAYYHFVDTDVPMFPIYSPFGQDGTLRQTHYPKAGERNPLVQVRILDLDSGKTVVAFDNAQDDCYFGTPFWSNDSKELYVSRMPRRQSQLDLIAVSAADGTHRQVYHEEHDTWIDWIEGMLFTDKGLYMARDFESGWQQIYFLGFDGSLKCLTDGPNWDISLLKVDTRRNTLWFTARRDSRLHPTLYKLDLRRGGITALTNSDYWTRNVEIADDGSFTAECSTATLAWRRVKGNSFGRLKLEEGHPLLYMTADGYSPKPQPVMIENEGYQLYGLINYPKDFDPSKKYPVIMEVYGGPGTAYVRDRWGDRDASNKWCWQNGIIYMVVDPRTSGENGRAGMDQAFRRMTVVELQDYIAWARYMQSLPYVDGAHIGVEGFSFGGTTTSMLVLRYPEYFHCGIAGGGVYDWHLYDSHYTERYMCTPDENPDGYNEASVLEVVRKDGISKDYLPDHLRLTHGTGDDNVHFQNTLQLVDALQQKGVQFELMIYPDGMHGYRGQQHLHDQAAAQSFWMRTLFD